MSRRKRTIPLPAQQDIKRLQAASQRLVDVDREFQQMQRRLDDLRQQRLQAASYDDYDYQSRVETTLTAYYNQLDGIESNASQAIAAQSDYFQQVGENFQTELWDHASGLLLEQSNWLEDTIEQQRMAQQSRIEQLQNSLLDVQQNIHSRQEIAAKCIQDAKDLMDHLQSQYNSEPGWQAEIRGLKLELEQAQSNLNIGFEEAALTCAQQLFQHLIEIQYRLDTYIQQRQISINSVMEIAEKVVDIICRNKHVQAMDLDGNPHPIELDVDFWSDGQFKLLLSEAQEILYQVRQPPAYLTLDEIDNLRSQLVSVQERIPEAIFLARLQVLSSQMRFNIAECVLKALRSEGYDLDFGRYAGRDMRCAYQLMVQNLGGSQILATVSPVVDQPLTQNLDLETNEQEVHNEHETRQRAHELDYALSLYGLKVGNIVGQMPAFNQESKSRKSVETPAWMSSSLERSFQH